MIVSQFIDTVLTCSLKLCNRRIKFRKVEQILADLKRETGNLGLAFDSLTELVADLKTIDIQLISSKPKTSIIRECFRSIRDVLENTDASESLLQVNRLLADR